MDDSLHDWRDPAQRQFTRENIARHPDAQFPYSALLPLLDALDALDASSGVDVERLARAVCIEAESLESHPADFEDCPDRDGHIDYVKAVLAEYDRRVTT